MKPVAHVKPTDEGLIVSVPTLYELTPSEITSFREQNLPLAEELKLPVRYEGGIEPAGLSGVGL